MISKVNSLEAGSSKLSEKASKNSGAASKNLVPPKVPTSAEPNSNEEKITQMRKSNKEILLPLHDRPNPMKNLDLPVFKSNTIKVTQTLKAHTMAVSG